MSVKTEFHVDLTWILEGSGEDLESQVRAIRETLTALDNALVDVPIKVIKCYRIFPESR